MPRIYRGGDDAPPAPPPYGVAALDSLHAPLISYLPLRRFNLLIWFLVGWIPIVGTAALAAQRPAWQNSLEPGALRAFNLAVAGNVATWLSSAAFALAAAVMAAIYSVRRHRRDDYRAHFTIWVWAMLAAAFASVDATAGLHHVWQGVCQYVVGAPRSGDGTIWWVGAWTLAFGGLMLRLLFEVRACRCAVFWNCLAAFCYGTAGLMQLDLLPPARETLQPIVETTIQLAGHHAFILGLVVYARHVVFEASGQAAPVKRGGRNAAATAASSDAPCSPPSTVSRPAARRSESPPDEESNTAPAPSTAPTSPSRPQLKAVSADADADANANDAAADGTHAEKSAETSVAGKMSRAERKRLRREQRRRMAA